MPVEIGISKILGMTSYECWCDLDEYELKAKNYLKILKNHEFFYVHIKGPDEFGHDGNAKGKKRNIEEIDERFFKNFTRGISKIKRTWIYISLFQEIIRHHV